MIFDIDILKYAFYETVIISSLMWIISPRAVLRNTKLALLTIPMIYLYLLIIPVNGLFTVTLFAAFLISLRYYFFNESWRIASRQIVGLYILKFLAFYLAAFLVLMKSAHLTTYQHIFKTSNVELVQFSLLYLLILIVQYRFAVNYINKIRGRSFYLELSSLLTILFGVIVYFLISNMVYRFYALNINAILNIANFNILMTLSMNVIVLLFSLVLFLFATYKSTKNEFSNFQTEAQIDKLTGLLTRVDGMRQLERVYQKSLIQHSNFVICFIDINDLKVINDHYGHREGDYAIQQVAKTVLSELRDTDFAFRYGGDEFVIVFDNCRLQDARNAWQRIDDQLEIINRAKLNQYKLQVSYGLSSHHQDKKLGLKHLIELADSEMYKRKREVKLNGQ
ncbi:MAG: hypothetical protein CSB19_01200 [Clostridiales bacterium]|nr:MAG: hypothetical protein CSB19_01200 [Clostridiales bacterium]